MKKSEMKNLEIHVQPTGDYRLVYQIENADGTLTQFDRLATEKEISELEIHELREAGVL